LLANGLRRCAPDDRLRAAIHRAGEAIPQRGSTDLPVGQITSSSNYFLSSAASKKISLRRYPKSLLKFPRPVPTEGRLAIVTNAGRDAVDVDALLTNGAEADGEVVWS
jgi:hypothetical protein